MQRDPKYPAADESSAQDATDGDALLIRRIEPGDFDQARSFLHALAYGTRYFRFGRGDFVHPDDEIRRILALGPDGHEHLVAVRTVDDVGAIVGSARFVVDADGTQCVFSIVVLDDWQRHGVGRRLMRALMASALDRGISTCVARCWGPICGWRNSCQASGSRGSRKRPHDRSRRSCGR